jgi:DNA-binding transcriptional MocR family regulator
VIDPLPEWLNPDQLNKGIAYINIASAITSAIRSGKLTAGTRLPTQRELATALNLNVGTVSRAYTEIKENGLIESRPRLGTYVKAIFDDKRGRVTAITPVISDVINLGTNTRIPTIFANAFGELMSTIGQNPNIIRSIEGYKPIGGIAEHRAAAARWMSAGNDETYSENEVLITDSATTAIFAILLSHCEAGDTVLTESLTFPGLIQIAASLRLKLAGVEMDHEGMRADALDAACKLHDPAVVIVTPTLQNPTCAIMGEQRRRDIADVISKYNALMIEDSVYRSMLPQAIRLPRIASFLPNQGIVVTSMSKTVAQVLRIGFIAGPQRLLAKLVGPLQAMAFTGPSLMAEMFCHWEADGTLKRIIDFHRDEMKERNEVARTIFKDQNFVSHPFSSHSWLEIPQSRSPDDFFASVMHAGVSVRLAREFAAEKSYHSNGIRITLGAAHTIPELSRALNIISDQLVAPTYARSLFA